ncbi:hypothetical protein CFOL_v3_30442, partial [Cephalotus follicularis]
RRDKGLCYNSDDKYHPSHVCKAKFFFMITDAEVELELDRQLANVDIASEEDIEMVPEISLHAIAGQVNPKTLRIIGQYFEHKLQFLIDGGSTHNFLQEKVAFGLSLPVIPTKPFKVFLGN